MVTQLQYIDKPYIIISYQDMNAIQNRYVYRVEIEYNLYSNTLYEHITKNYENIILDHIYPENSAYSYALLMNDEDIFNKFKNDLTFDGIPFKAMLYMPKSNIHKKYLLDGYLIRKQLINKKYRYIITINQTDTKNNIVYMMNPENDEYLNNIWHVNRITPLVKTFYFRTKEEFLFGIMKMPSEITYNIKKIITEKEINTILAQS